MKKLHKIIPSILLTVSLSFASHGVVYANEIDERLKIHGFASQGYVLSPDAPFAGTQTENGSFDFREFGLNLSFDFNEKTRVAGQILNRQQGDSVKSKTSLDFLLVDRVIYQDAKTSFGVRLGRVKNDVGLYNSIRDIPSARPGIDVPKSIYFDSFRDTFISVDGINLYGNHLADAGLFEWNLFYGNKNIDSKALEYYALGGKTQGDYDVKGILGGKLTFEPNDISGLKLGLSAIKTKVKLEDANTYNDSVALLFSRFGALGVNPMDGVDAREEAIIAGEVRENLNEYAIGNENDINLFILSLQYAFKDIVLSSEMLRIINESSISIPSLAGPQSINSKGNVSGFFVQLEWFPASSWSTLVRYEELVLDDDRSVEEFARSYDQTHGYQKALTFGAKWNIDNHWSLTGQMGFNEGTAWIPIYEGMENDQTTQYWKIYRAALNYQF